MIAHFLSDLHLSEEQPHLVRLFETYLEEHAPEADEIYILGDLFEVWIGDDYAPDWILNVSQKLNELSNSSTKIFYIHGNRDFLLGQQFAKNAGITLLDEYSKISLNGQSVLLCHGDTLCIDDKPYQAFRNQVRTEKWQSNFLSLPLEKRLETVNNYRQQSKEATAEKSSDIMDVNQDEVDRVFDTFDVEIMIHGHTHRPATHVKQGCLRIVLSDWGDTGQFLKYTNHHFRSYRFDETSISEDPDLSPINLTD